MLRLDIDHEDATKLHKTMPSVRSKVVKVNIENNSHQPEVVQFKEEGEIVEMEIDDGGAAAAEFASKSEEEQDR